MSQNRDENALRAQALSLLMPLHFFYERHGLELPPITFMEGAQLPRQERELLVHDRDMTSTLSRFHRSELDLQVLEKQSSPDYLLRLVLLTKRELPVPVEFGAIGIRLEALPPALREKIQEGRVPLGGLLSQFQIRYESAPQAFFQIAVDAFIAERLLEPVGSLLCGRCNTLMLPNGEVFADIVEIVPPASVEAFAEVQLN